MKADHKNRFDLSDARRRIANLMLIGKVVEVDAAGVRARVQIGEMITALLPWVSPRAAVMNCWTAPAIGEQVLVVCHNGDPAQGVIVGSINSINNPAPSFNPNLFKVIFSDGSYVEHNVATREMKTHCAGKVDLTAAGDVNAVTEGSAKITAAVKAEVTAPDIGLTGNVTITGALAVTGLTQLATAKVAGTVLAPGNNNF